MKRALVDAQLPAEYLEIELTESVAFGDPAVFSTFDALKAIGMRFAAFVSQWRGAAMNANGLRHPGGAGKQFA